MCNNKPQNKKAILLINIGSPASSSVSDVKRYLKKFLNDPCVIDLPQIMRYPLVNGVIIPLRIQHSTNIYQEHFSQHGPLLLKEMLNLQKALQNNLLEQQTTIEIAMRYSDPSIEDSMLKMAREGVSEVTIIPLYPQSTLATTKSCTNECLRVLHRHKLKFTCKIVHEFYSDDLYIKALSAKIGNSISGNNFDKLILSYHSIPYRHLKKVDYTPSYEEQCKITTDLVAKQLQLPQDFVLTCFQSRLGRKKGWLTPTTSETITRLAHEGARKIAITCPAFICDCIETVHEIALGEKMNFTKNQGEQLCFIESLGSYDEWIFALTKIACERAIPLKV